MHPLLADEWAGVGLRDGEFTDRPNPRVEDAERPVAPPKPSVSRGDAPSAAWLLGAVHGAPSRTKSGNPGMCSTLALCD